MRRARRIAELEQELQHRITVNRIQREANTVDRQANYKLMQRNLELEDLVRDYRDANGHLRQAIDKLRTENRAWQLNAKLGALPDLTVMHIDMVELERSNDRLRAENDRLRSQLDNANADRQTQAAFLREGYRFKTGEHHG